MLVLRLGNSLSQYYEPTIPNKCTFYSVSAFSSIVNAPLRATVGRKHNFIRFYYIFALNS